MIALTFDTDWAAERVIADTVELLDRYGAKATFFATHGSPVLNGLDRENFEIGLHPNFLPLLEGNGGHFREVLDALLAIYPESRGFRGHGLVHSGLILQYAADIGLRYDSNIFCASGMAPFRDYQGLVRIPIFWADMLHAILGGSFALGEVPRNGRSPTVFNFHPISVFLNVEVPERYHDAKPFLQDMDRLEELKNTSGVPGVRDFLTELLKTCRDQDIELRKMAEIASDELG